MPQYITDRVYIDITEDGILLFNVETERNITLPPLPSAFIKSLLSNPNNIVKYCTMLERIYGETNYKSRDPHRLKNLHILKDRCNTYLTNIIGDKEHEILFNEAGKGYGIRLYKGKTFDKKEVGTVLATPSVIQTTAIPQEHFNELIECALYKGLVGKMGRHTLRTQADNGNALGCFCMGELFYYGYVTENRQPDFAKAREWFSKAAKYNHPGALWSIGYMIMNNKYPNVAECDIDYMEALSYFEKAGTNCAEALNSIGKLHEEGKYPCTDFSVSKKCQPADIEKALDYYRRAAAKGYHYAMNNLGNYYLKKARLLQAESQDASKELKSAFEWFKLSADSVPDGYTYTKVGLMYEAGEGCKKDLEIACAYYLRSVNDVFPDDITPLARFHAARVYSNCIPSRISAQHYNLDRAWDLFPKALDGLPIRKDEYSEKHISQQQDILQTMMNVILALSCSGNVDLIEQAQKFYTRTVISVKRYLFLESEFSQFQKYFENIQKSLNNFEQTCSDIFERTKRR